MLLAASSSPVSGSDVRLVAGLLLLMALAVAACAVVGVAHRQAIVIASVRAAVQLFVVAAALRGVFAAPWAVVGVLAVMFGVATWTATRRLRNFPHAYSAVVRSCGGGAAVAIAVVLGLPMLQRDVRTLVAVSGIVIGGCMTAATLTGRRLADGLHRRREEVEGWLALGATSRHAVRDVARSAMHDALIPALDQTRTVGLVTLPGTFVGALIGGAGAAGAARFQLTVLVALLCAQAITSATLIWLLGAPAVLPATETG
jgi:putative ABC transport system permease protein